MKTQKNKKVDLTAFTEEQIITKISHLLEKKLYNENVIPEQFKIISDSIDYSKASLKIIALCKNNDFDKSFDDSQLLQTDINIPEFSVKNIFPYLVYIMDISFRETMWESSNPFYLENTLQCDISIIPRKLQLFYNFSSNFKEQAVKLIFNNSHDISYCL